MRQLSDQDPWFQELVRNNIPGADRSEKNLNHVVSDLHKLGLNTKTQIRFIYSGSLV